MATLLSCGNRTNTHFTLSPTDSFDHLYEETPSSRVCESVLKNDKSLGCAKVFAAGTVVNGSFSFQDLFTKCTTTANGTSIEITNANLGQATFEISISLYKVNTLSGLFSCSGPETIAIPPSIDLKPGYCAITARLYSNVFAATPGEPCYLTLSNTNPLSGQILCNHLTAKNQSISIGEGSVFSCQP